MGWSLGLPVSAKRIPKRAKEQTARKKYPDIFMMPGMNAVSERFKSLVEQFEPGVHQFFPLDLSTKSGEPVDGQYFVFNCTVSFDSILMAKSEVVWDKLDQVKICPSVILAWASNTSLSRQAIAGRHIWQNFSITTHRGLLVSDEFEAAMASEKITYYRRMYCQELDEEWVPEKNILPILDWEERCGLDVSSEKVVHPD